MIPCAVKLNVALALAKGKENTLKLLTKRRQEMGLTRTEIGRLALVHPARVGQIELGRVVPPPSSVELARLARALRFSGNPASLLDEVSDAVIG